MALSQICLLEEALSTICRDSTADDKKKSICTKQTYSNTDSSKSLHHDIYYQTVPKNEGRLMAYIRDKEYNMGFVTAVIWKNVFLIGLFHIVTVVWFFSTVYSGYIPKWQTVAFGFFLGQAGGFGVTAGAHRYWCHHSYKAKTPLQIILLLCYSIAGQNSIDNWVRDHRVHHKYSETSADPHDARRGFFFSHVGWLMMKKHPDILREGRNVDMSDIKNDALVQFHTKYFNIFKLVCCFVAPAVIPILFWEDNWSYAILSQAMVRYVCTLNFTWSVNSFAHIWGNRPYDRNIMPAENWCVSIVAMGEGWHNYHHTFPWDYKAAELGYILNFTTLCLELFAKIGWAYDMKQASPAFIEAVKNKRGEASKKLT